MISDSMRSGVTLVELIVVLAIVGIIAGVTTLAFRGADRTHDTAPWIAAVAAARRAAIDSARTVTFTVTVSDSAHAVTALPDGSIIGDARLGFDRLTGQVIRAK